LFTLNSAFIGEVIIVDNGCSLPADKIEIVDKRIKIISEPKIGLNYARNTGISYAVQNIISFVDDDIVVSSHWAESIIKGYAHDVCCVGGPVLVNSDKPKRYPHWFSDYFLRFLLPPKFPTQAGIIYPPYYLIGANISFKRETFTRFGLFDIDLDRKGKNLLSNGDIEFVMRIPANKVWYEPQAVVYEKIPEKRLTRRFLARRLFWQGISDYIMIIKRGRDNFYDRSEILFNYAFLRKIILVAMSGYFFEFYCRLTRWVGFICGRIYLKNQEAGTKLTS
jgi:glycosyltransferase involved in cell wall biosynthesis